MVSNKLDLTKLENERIRISKKYNLKFEKFAIDYKNIFLSENGNILFLSII